VCARFPGAAMFQPQPTPYAHLVSYGVGYAAQQHHHQRSPSSQQHHQHFQHSPQARQSAPSPPVAAIAGARASGRPGRAGQPCGDLGLARQSAGSIIFTTPAFSAAPNPAGAFSSSFNTTSTPSSTSARPHSTHPLTMDSSLADDLAAQEAAAREYQPQLEVRIYIRLCLPW
jgi:ubiquitin thioesterase protein OTUB1